MPPPDPPPDRPSDRQGVLVKVYLTLRVSAMGFTLLLPLLGLASAARGLPMRQAVQTRLAIAPDNTQVSRTTARKLLTLTQTVTVAPDGTVTVGLPANRPAR